MEIFLNNTAKCFIFISELLSQTVSSTMESFLNNTAKEERSELMAISPLDGRYARQVKKLSAYLSEYGLIRYQVLVEV